MKHITTLHDETGGQGEPLVVGDWLMVGVSHLGSVCFSLHGFYIDQLRRCSSYRKGDEDIEGECDEDGGDEAEEEEEDEEVFDEVLLHKALLIHHLCPG